MIMPKKVDDFEGPQQQPVIKPCHFCQKEVRLQKDQTEGQAVACFEHSHRFTPKVEK